MTQDSQGHFRVSERGKRSNQWRVISELAPAHSVFQWELSQNNTKVPERAEYTHENNNPLIITCTNFLKHGFSVDSRKTRIRAWIEYGHSTLAVYLPLWFTHMHMYTLWMWNIIMHETGPMSVSYEPAVKPLVDKSPPTGVQEFGGLMKKSCWAGRSWPAWLWGFQAPYRGPNRGGAVEHNGGKLAGSVAWIQYHWTVWEFTAAIGDSAEQVCDNNCEWESCLCSCEYTVCEVWSYR